ncbi:MAG: 4-(cytidine 5'-diphospho)-2-C-methyl-D-erythritol kinase [Planctomycetota bacterium]
MRLDTPAKVNLTLDVLGRRDDGYHELDTVFAAVSLFDQLTFSAGPGPGRIDLVLDPRSTAPGRELVPTDGGNLVVRAGRQLAESAGRTLPGVHITLAKMIPVQGGLGGGSSDAAAALLGLNAYWGLGRSRAELAAIGAELGSDVPFFVHGVGWARGRGRGEVIDRLPAGPPLDLVLAKPASGLSAAEVYRAYRPGRGRPLSDAMTDAVTSGSSRGVLRSTGNDLECPAVSVQNEVGETLRRLRDAGAGPVRTSGSGTTCFGVVGTRRATLRAVNSCRRGPVVWTKAVRTLARF